VGAQFDIKLSRASKSYVVEKRKIEVLKDVNLTLNRGELSCIIGPNGCGKTTLVRIVAGIETLSSGVCQKSGKISYLPQQDSLLPWFTLKENIELPGRINATLNRDTRGRIRRYLKRYKLEKFADFYPSEISGGMKQKTALIRAIAYRPEIIILDEPFSALDAITRIEMRQMLADLWLENKPTILCVTHDIDEAIYLSDRIFVMSTRPGKIAKTFRLVGNRPRTIESIDLPEALKIKKELHRLLLK
jgi:NitT/TauT family transport system ATP-binding protein